jgi:hypothetical protein
MVGIALMAVLSAFVHYWIDGPEAFRLVVMRIGMAVYLGVAVLAVLLLAHVLRGK